MTSPVSRTFGSSYTFLRPLITRYAVVDHLLARGRQACQSLLGGFVAHALDLEEQTDLTCAIYERLPQARRAVYPWEAAWFERDLPRPPARILLGGAGNGVEVRWLQAAGYHVDAFEPSVNEGGSMVRGTYEDLVAAAHSQPNALSPLAANRYDAVIAGWGSLTHVLAAESRRALFEVWNRLCPRGPILASFWSAEARPNAGRAHAYGARLGRTLGALRRVQPVEEPANQFLSHAGFGHWFSQAEIEQLAAAIGRSVDFERSPYPHATWRAR